MTVKMDIETTSTETPATAFRGARRLCEPCALTKPTFPGRDRTSDSNDESTLEPNARSSPIEADLAQLQTQAVEGVRAYVLAITHRVSTLVGSVDAPVAMTIRNGQLRRQGLALNEQIDDFIESVRQFMSGLNDRAQSIFHDAPQVAPIAKSGHDDRVLSARLQLLTARENAALELLLKGLPNKQISYELGIEIPTAKAHIHSILRKLNVSSRSRVIALLANVDAGASTSLSR